MGFFAWGNGTSDSAEGSGTISDKEWRDIQGRALKANPKMKDTFSKESAQSRARGSANYNNRKSC